MDLIFNSGCNILPEGAKPLASSGTALLNLLHCLGYDAQNPPLADLLSKFYQLDGHWLILSPMHWQATHNDALIIAAGDDLELSEEDARSWFNSFAEYLAPEQMRLHYHDKQTWLLHDPQQHPLTAKPVHQLLHQSLTPELAQLDDTLFWQRFLTESQMLFASKANQTAMNGLWPWSNSVLGEKKAIAICADETFLPWAQLCSSKVTLYTPDIKLKEQQILLINDYSLLSEPHQDALKKMYAHWYWNNTAYTCNSGNWFLCLWRKLIHAH